MAFQRFEREFLREGLIFERRFLRGSFTTHHHHPTSDPGTRKFKKSPHNHVEKLVVKIPPRRSRSEQRPQHEEI